MLRVDNVTFSYDTARRVARLGLRDARRSALDVLRGVTLQVPRGRVVGVLGPNGCGKTTLMRLMAGLLTPTTGGVLLDGQPVATLSRRQLAQRIALVPQETQTTFDHSVLDMVLMGRFPHIERFALEGPRDLALARDALAATGTATLEHRTFGTLSGGEKQRVIIAAALAQASDVLLLDEPTASLDLGYQMEIAALLRRLNRERGTTMVLSTHDLNLAAALCDHLVLLRHGGVVAQGTAAETLTSVRVHEVYGVDADVQYHERAGHVTVVPLAHHH